MNNRPEEGKFVMTELRHNCDESLKDFGDNDITYDASHDEWHLSAFRSPQPSGFLCFRIFYCPFCGTALERSNNETSGT